MSYMLYRHGFVLGKFMPLHAGHVYLIETAQKHCHALTILLCSQPGEPISGETRLEWLRKQFPQANLVHRPNPLPRDAWTHWIVGLCPTDPFDVVFSSESYGEHLAKILGIPNHVEIDRLRKRFPVSGTAVRTDLDAHWKYLPEHVKEFYR